MFLLGFVIAVLASVSGQESFNVVNADPSSILTGTGQTINITCRLAKPITSCSFNIPGDYREIKMINSKATNDDYNRYRYYGSGIENGQCGITILSIRNENNGNATCNIVTDDGQTNAIRKIEIIVAIAPYRPEIKVDNVEEMVADSFIEANCSSRYSNSPAYLSWYLNDQPLGPGEAIVKKDYDYSEVSIQSTIRYQLKREDNGKKLICRAYHPSYNQYGYGFEDAQYSLNVKYQPILIDTNIHIPSLKNATNQNRFNLGPIRIHANPRPSIKWIVDGVAFIQGQQKERFGVPDPKESEAGSGFWEVSLTIVGFLKADVQRSYAVEAINALGTSNFNLTVSWNDPEALGKIIRVLTSTDDE